jgi:hypothetical protein
VCKRPAAHQPGAANDAPPPVKAEVKDERDNGEESKDEGPPLNNSGFATPPAKQKAEKKGQGAVLIEAMGLPP